MTATQEAKEALAPGDFVPLQTLDEYASYFRQLQRVFLKLMDFYRLETENQKGKHYETNEISHFLTRFLHTAEALRVKYTYDPTHNLRVDLTESGFFNAIELENLRADFQNRNSRLEKLPELVSLKREMLDYMFKFRTEPALLLHTACRRYYLEMLDSKKLFFPFNPSHSLYRKTDEGKFRTYDFSWSCFDFVTNRPFIHILRFQQDRDRPPLDERLENYDQFLEIIRSEGSRVPEIGILALGIDGAMKEIHPKILKRTGIGPI